jgi:hypothetical protein
MPFVQKRIARHDHQLCDDDVPSFEPVFKAFDDTIDPAMQADIEALQRLYQNAMSGMSATVDRIREGLIRQGRGDDLRLFQETFAAQAIEDLRRSLGDVSLATEEQVMAEIQAAITRLPSGVAGVMRFDNKDPRAIRWAEQRAGAMIKQIEVDTLQAVRGAISRVLTGGGGIQRAARDISRVVGLHDRWQTAVNNYYNKEVARLTRTAGLENAIIQAQELALKYRDQLIRARAVNIARTEILAAQNIGQVLSWYQAADQGYLDLATAEKEWVIGPDGWRGVNVCPICLDLAGSRVPVLSVFSNGEICPPAHPSCRCTLNLIALVGVGDEVDALTSEDVVD